MAVRLSLPLLVTPKNKLPLGLVGIATAGLLYITSNHLHFFEPKYLPLWSIDRQMPFIPITYWVYVSEYIFFAAIYATAKDFRNLSKYIYSFLSLQIVSVIIFYLWPTTYPRDLFPIPEGTDAVTTWAFSMLRAADTPANCCPSLHVSSVFLSAMIYLDEQREKFPIFLLWGIAIALSTLTTKQHYIVDVITGIMMAGLFYWFFHHKVSYHAGLKFAQDPLAVADSNLQPQGVQAKR